MINSLQRVSSTGAVRRVTPARQRGVGLIEVLLAVVLLSIGFLAAARMQIEGMNASQNSYSLSQAKFMVLDMSERMRANRVALTANRYDGVETRPGTSEPPCVSAGTACSPTERAQADIHAWSQLLHPSDDGTSPLLPSTPTIEAKGTVDLVDGVYEVTAVWAERVNGDSEQRSVSIRVVP